MPTVLTNLLYDLGLRRAKAEGGLILAFHEISTARFAACVRRLQRRLTLVPLDEIVQRLEHGYSVAGLFALTFDDGWAATCEPVAALCEREGWPVMMYLVGCLTTTPGTLWFAELPALLDGARGRRVESGDFTLDLTSPRVEERSVEELMTRLKLLSGGDSLRAIDALRSAAGLPPRQRGAGTFVGAEFVRRYAKSRWVRFGAHTMDHQAMAPQTAERIHTNLAASREVLEELTGEQIRHFAYPYGARETMGTIAPRLIRQHFASATTMVRGLCGARSDLALLPRLDLYESDGPLRTLAKVLQVSLRGQLARSDIFPSVHNNEH